LFAGAEVVQPGFELHIYSVLSGTAGGVQAPSPRSSEEKRSSY
jgi:hypothetical protein